jgi:hypothetical protein
VVGNAIRCSARTRTMASRSPRTVEVRGTHAARVAAATAISSASSVTWLSRSDDGWSRSITWQMISMSALPDRMGQRMAASVDEVPAAESKNRAVGEHLVEIFDRGAGLVLGVDDGTDRPAMAPGDIRVHKVPAGAVEVMKSSNKVGISSSRPLLTTPPTPASTDVPARTSSARRNAV